MTGKLYGLNLLGMPKPSSSRRSGVKAAHTPGGPLRSGVSRPAMWRVLEIHKIIRAGQRGITKNEDARLNSLGLRDTMPPNWNWRAVEPDLFARYRAANIDWK